MPRVVLVRTSHPGNIGAAARAMKTMGLRELVLVAPHAFPHPEAVAMAAGADDLLQEARVCASLDEAIRDCTLVFGCTARRRGVPLPEWSPRAAAQQLTAAARSSAVALLFGHERTGLENDELQRCHGAVHIPADPQFGSLNLAAAVQVLAYELRLASAAPAGTGRVATDPPASVEQFERWFASFARLLEEIDFHKGRSPVTVLRRLRRLYLRAAPDQRELRILLGILADIRRQLRLRR